MSLAGLFRTTPTWERQLQQGVTCMEQQRYPEALTLLEQAATAARRAQNITGVGRAQALAAHCYQQLSQFDRTAEAYGAALSNLQEVLDGHTAATMLSDLGTCLRRCGEPGRAVEALSLGIEANAGQDRALEQSLFNNLGNAWNDQDEPLRARQCFERTLELAQELGDRRGEAVALGNLGIAARKLGDDEAAHSFYQQNYTIARELGDRRSEAVAISNLGNLYAEHGLVDRALACYEERIAIATEVGDAVDVAMTRYNLALLLDKAGRREDALASAFQAERAFAASGQAERASQARQLVARLSTRAAPAPTPPPVTGQTVRLTPSPDYQRAFDEGLAAIRDGAYERAMECLHAVAEAARAAGDLVGELCVAQRLAPLCHDLGALDIAATVYHVGLELADELGDEMATLDFLGDLSALELERQRYEDAADHAEQHLMLARQLKDQRAEQGALNNLGSASLRLNRYSEAAVHFAESLRLAQRLGLRGEEVKTLSNLGVVRFVQGDVDLAMQHQADALEIADAIGKRSLQMQVLGNLAQCHEAKGNLRLALELYERTLSLARAERDQRAIGITQYSMASILKQTAMRADALRRLQEALTIFEALDDKIRAAMARQLIASIDSTYAARSELV